MCVQLHRHIQIPFEKEKFNLILQTQIHLKMKQAFIKDLDIEKRQNMSDFERKHSFQRKVFKGFIQITFSKNEAMDESKDEQKSNQGRIDIELTDSCWPDGDSVTEWCIDQENKKLILFHMAVGELYMQHRALLYHFDPSKKLFDRTILSFEPMIKKLDKYHHTV